MMDGMNKADLEVRKSRLASAPLWRLVLFLALPALGQQFLVFSVSLSDRLLAGRFQAVPQEQRIEAFGKAMLALGGRAHVMPGAGPITAIAAEAPLLDARHLEARQASFLAAQTTANYLAWFISSYMVLVSVGSTALVARLTGAGDRRAAIHATNQSILLAFGLGLLGSILGLTFMRPLVETLQLRGEAADFAVAYLRPIFLVLALQIVEYAGIACLVGAGDTRTGFLVTLGVAVINLPLAWSFCLGWGPFPALGFVGISVGTAISQGLGGLAMLVLLARGRHGLKLELPQLWPDAPLLRRLLRISIPAGLDSLSLVVGQLWFLSIINRLGNVASSAHGIALTWEAMGYLSGNAVGTAAMTLVGQNLGAGRPARAARSGWVAFGLGCAVMTFMGALFYTFARPMFRLFCPHPSEVAIVDAGVPVLQLVAFAMPMLASTIIFTAALRGAGDTRVPVLFTWIGFLAVRIPLAYLLTQPMVDLGIFGTRQFGLYGAWLAMFADLAVRGMFFLGRFAGGSWQHARV
jgi:putative MATE family efflux protein